MTLFVSQPHIYLTPIILLVKTLLNPLAMRFFGKVYAVVVTRSARVCVQTLQNFVFIRGISLFPVFLMMSCIRTPLLPKDCFGFY